MQASRGNDCLAHRKESEVNLSVSCLASVSTYFKMPKQLVSVRSRSEGYLSSNNASTG